MGKVISTVVVIVIVIGAVLFFRHRSKESSEYAPTLPSSSEVIPTPTPIATASVKPSVNPKASASPSAAKTKTLTITYGADGLTDITSLTIKVGDIVKFINNDSQPHWPASGVHPTHQICPGFDALHGLTTGESYSFTFKIAKTCPFHDHLNPSHTGQIIVTP